MKIPRASVACWGEEGEEENIILWAARFALALTRKFSILQLFPAGYAGWLALKDYDKVLCCAKSENLSIY